MSGGITGEFQQAMNEFQQVGGEIRQVSGELHDSTRSLLDAADPRSALPRTISDPAPSPAFVRDSAPVGSRPSKADPLADFGTYGEAAPATPPTLAKATEVEETREPRSDEPAA